MSNTFSGLLLSLMTWRGSASTLEVWKQSPCGLFHSVHSKKCYRNILFRTSSPVWVIGDRTHLSAPPSRYQSSLRTPPPWDEYVFFPADFIYFNVYLLFILISIILLLFLFYLTTWTMMYYLLLSSCISIILVKHFGQQSCFRCAI